MNNLVPGSLGQIAARDKSSIARVFMDCDEIILVDTSGSMMSEDSTGGQSRYSVACQELCKLQRDLPGKLAIFAFSDSCVFCPNGVPGLLKGGTRLLDALKYVIAADGTVGFTVISDGYPDSGTDDSIVMLVRQMKSRVNAIFAGGSEDHDGRMFMKKLADAGRGRDGFSDRSKDLQETVMLLMSPKIEE